MPAARARTAATALSRASRIARWSLTVVTPAAAAASSRLWPGPEDTVFSTKASYRAASVGSSSHRSVTVPFGRRTSTWCPQERSTSTTAPGITSFSYFSSTMKQSRTGGVSRTSPNSRIAETSICFVALDRVSLELVIGCHPSCPPGRQSAWEHSGPDGAGWTGPQGWPATDPGVVLPHQGGAPDRGPTRVPTKVAGDDTSCGSRSPLRCLQPKVPRANSLAMAPYKLSTFDTGDAHAFTAFDLDSLLPSRRHGDRVRVVGHRGSVGPDSPENSAAAVTEALLRGADGAEIDVWLTADGTLVCAHDLSTADVDALSTLTEVLAAAQGADGFR